MDRVKEKYPKNSIGYIIGDISVVLADLLLSKTTTVVLSDISLAKNLKNHPDLLVEDYLRLDVIIGKGHFVIQDSDRTVAIVLENKTLYHYSLKSTQTGEALFLTSFRKTSFQDVNRLRKKAVKKDLKILKDALP